MSTLAYQLNPFDQLLDASSANLWLHDLPEDKQELHAQALAASGDYFELLASELEQIATALPMESIEQYRVQHYIGQLLYLQRHYRIVKK